MHDLALRKNARHGDDFLIIDRRGLDDPITADIARHLGNRHTGIGFNQLAVVLDCDDAAARIKFWNPNGTPLETCGSAYARERR